MDDIDTIDTLVLEQIPRLRRYARDLTGDRERADDLVQDCLERAWARIGQWQPGTNMRTWLFTIMHNLYANQARRYNRGPTFIPFDDDEHATLVASESMTAKDIKDIDDALAALPPQQRAVIQLVCIEEMKYEDVAKILSIPVGTVMSRLSRAREQLRFWLLKNGGPMPGRIK